MCFSVRPPDSGRYILFSNRELPKRGLGTGGRARIPVLIYHPLTVNAAPRLSPRSSSGFEKKKERGGGRSKFSIPSWDSSQYHQASAPTLSIGGGCPGDHLPSEVGIDADFQPRQWMQTRARSFLVGEDVLSAKDCSTAWHPCEYITCTFIGVMWLMQAFLP